ncbi:MAG: hypothetical protein RL087_435, partial [Pseudomonadota bacterium]
RGRRARAERSAHGIVIDDGTWAEIVQSGAKVGLPAAAFA